MKHFANILLTIFAAAFLAAGCNDDNPTQNTDGTKVLNLNGQLLNWQSGVKTLSFAKVGKKFYVLETAPIKPSGSFNIYAPVPPLSELEPIKGIFLDPSNYTEIPWISDTTARFFEGGLAIMQDNDILGIIEWVSDKVVDPKTGYWEEYIARYIYFDKSVEIKGRFNSPSYFPIDYDFSAVPGWNILYFKSNERQEHYYINYNKELKGNYEYWLEAE